MTNQRRRLTGEIIKAATEKTVTVRVDRTYRHPFYQKVLRGSKRYMVHNELECGVGDQVRIVESRPLSKRKRWVVEEVLHKTEPVE